MRRSLATTSLLCLGFAGTLSGQALADRILAVREGTVRLSFGVREGICGDGETFIRDRSRGENNMISFDDGNSSWKGRGGAIDPASRARPGSPSPNPAEKSPGSGSMSAATGGAAPAASPISGWSRPRSPPRRWWPSQRAPKRRQGHLRRDHRRQRGGVADLLALAKDSRARNDTRKNAVFWLSQAAGDEATKGLTELAEDDDENRDVRDQAVFAISQLKDNEGVPVLIRLARTNRDPKIRRKALFWLGQSDDPRAFKLFEEILTRG